MKVVNGQKSKANDSSPAASSSGKAKSKVVYPYWDLDSSIEVARAVRDQGGGVCNGDQLAVFLKYASKGSGTFFSRIQAARLFGLVSFEDSNYAPTERADAILSPVMPEDEARARLDAFLDIPLFSGVFGELEGKNLPPEVGLKNLLKTRYGIVENRVGPALRILMDSAEQAGLFKTTGDRTKMIRPVVGASRVVETKPPETQDRIDRPRTGGGGGSGGDGAPPGIHSAIVGLLRELPPAGSDWPNAKKQRFLSAFQAILDVVYRDTEEPK
jgi:hypothetical protein